MIYGDDISAIPISVYVVKWEVSKEDFIISEPHVLVSRYAGSMCAGIDLGRYGIGSVYYIPFT